jgi:adenylate cyclase class 2
MREIEQKFAGADFAALEERLRQRGARPGDAHDEADHYFNAPDRDFARTDEAFRLRRVGRTNVLTYKGPKLPGPVKKRTELEVPLLDGDETAETMIQMLVHLGYRPVIVVRKHRRTFHWQQGSFELTACLDEVEGLGRFAEVEVLAPNEKEKEAEELIVQTAADLGLTRVERRSYLEMVLATHAGGPGR